MRWGSICQRVLVWEVVAALTILACASGAMARTTVGRTAAELERPQEWGEPPEEAASPVAQPKISPTPLPQRASKRTLPPPPLPGHFFPDPFEPTPWATEAATVPTPVPTARMLFPTPMPNRNAKALEIEEQIHNLGADAHQSEKAVERLVMIGAPAVPALRRALKAPATYMRVRALSALARMRTPDAVLEIEALLQDPAYEVRAEAISTLGKMRVKGSIVKIAQCLQDPEVRVRCAAVMALGRFRTSEACGFLIQALSDSNPDVRCRAAQELPAFAEHRVVTALLGATHAQDPGTIAYAARALGEIADPGARPRLLELLQNSNRSVQSEAAAALKNMAEEAH